MNRDVDTLKATAAQHGWTSSRSQLGFLTFEKAQRYVVVGGFGYPGPTYLYIKGQGIVDHYDKYTAVLKELAR
jgi:hypothetical protein